MTTTIIIPVSDLRNTKNRLSSLLNPDERRQLTLNMLEDVLTAISGSRLDKKVIVVTSNREVLGAAKLFRCNTLRDVGNGLNSTVLETIRRLRKDSDRLLIIPADLPLLSGDDLDVLIGDPLNSDIILSPSRDGGTNALSIPATLKNLRPQYGTGSFHKHFESMVEKGEEPIAYWSFKMSLDIDTATDLIDFWRVKSATRTHAFLESIELESRMH